MGFPAQMLNLAYASAISSYGIYIGGGGLTSVKHNLTADTMGSGGSLSTNQSGAVGASTSTTGYVAQGGSYTNLVSKYTFSTDGVSAGTALTYGMVNVSGAGNNVKMVTGAGNRGGNGGVYVTNAVEKYTYSGDTTAVTTSLNQTADARTATGNVTLAIFLGGNPDPGAGSKYTYSSDTVASVSNYVGTNRYRAAPAASSTKGYYMSGTNGTALTNVDVWTFSNDTRVSGTVISTAVDGAAGANCPTFGVKSGGSNGSNVTNVEKYVFSNDTVSNMTSLSSGNAYATGLSTNGNNLA